jgi:DNA recombination protein RmuC
LETLVLPVATVIALVLGVAVGWWLASRAAAPVKSERDQFRTESEKWRSKFNEAIVNLAGEAQKTLRLADVEAQLAAERDAASNFRSEVARLEADSRNFEKRMKDLAESKEALIAQFREVGDQLLEKAQKDFLDRAGERFSKADQQSEAKLKQLLQPVEATLKRYQEGLQRVEGERKDTYGELRSLLGELKKDQTQVRDETRNLVNTLRSSPKSRGKWGEQSLKNVLEQAGLSPYADFRSEVSVDTGEGHLRPDVVVRLPGDKHLVIDAKCSLNAFMDAADEVDDEKRAKALKRHASSIRNHVQQLGSKNYWSQFDSVDYVVMFVPGEHFLTAALDEDDTLWDFAFDKRVLLATPSNLVAIARTISMVWQQEKLATEAAQIAALGKELHARIASMASHVVKLGRNLESSARSYNQMVGSLETQVLTQAKRFESLGAGSSKIIEDLPIADTPIRDTQKLIVIAGIDADAEEAVDRTGTND